MKRNLIAICVAGTIASSLLLTGCTQNTRARAFGGNMDIKLPPRMKLVNATWKQDQLWYLTRPMRSNEVAETSIFQEKSSWGMIEGTVSFIESR